MKSLENPPIMKPASWMRAAPFKEEKFHRTPSESIANNYTPTAKDLKMKALRRHTQGMLTSERLNTHFSPW